MTRALRFGCQFQAFRGRREFLDTARRIEDLGFAVATFPDHFGGWASPWPSVVAAASVTSTLRLGPMTINNDLWNPAVLAYDAASADQLSDGRVELGIGAGWRAADYALAGITEDPPSTRIAWLAASTCRHPRCASAPAMATATGCARCKSRLPIFVGGGGRQILRLGGDHRRHRRRPREPGWCRRRHRRERRRRADTTTAGCASTRSSGASVGLPVIGPRSLPAPELHLYVLDVRRGGSSVESAEAPAATYGISPAAVVESPWFLTGPEEEMARKLVAINERYGISYFTVGEEHADALHAVMKYL